MSRTSSSTLSCSSRSRPLGSFLRALSRSSFVSGLSRCKSCLQVCVCIGLPLPHRVINYPRRSVGSRFILFSWFHSFVCAHLEPLELRSHVRVLEWLCQGQADADAAGHRCPEFRHPCKSDTRITGDPTSRAQDTGSAQPGQSNNTG